MLLTLKGTPYIYQGQEIGMENVAFPKIKDYRDLWSLNHYRESEERGEKASSILKRIHYRSRDNSRTPMQWDESSYAGFSTVEPWIKVNPNYQSINVANAEKSSESVLHTYRDLIELRKRDSVLLQGRFQRLPADQERVFAYLRYQGSDKRAIVINFSTQEQSVTTTIGAGGSILFSNWPYKPQTSSTPLRPFEARIYAI